MYSEFPIGSNCGPLFQYLCIFLFPPSQVCFLASRYTSGRGKGAVLSTPVFINFPPCISIIRAMGLLHSSDYSVRFKDSWLNLGLKLCYATSIVPYNRSQDLCGDRHTGSGSQCLRVLVSPLLLGVWPGFNLLSNGCLSCSLLSKMTVPSGTVFPLSTLRGAGQRIWSKYSSSHRFILKEKERSRPRHTTQDLIKEGPNAILLFLNAKEGIKTG